MLELITSGPFLSGVFLVSGSFFMRIVALLNSANSHRDRLPDGLSHMDLESILMGCCSHSHSCHFNLEASPS